ncbi:MAG: hypothetical protein ABMA13_20640 [Chthoniobacteraceae bacterium]
MRDGDYLIKTIPARDWNAARKLVRANRPLPGPGLRMAWTPDGVWVSLRGEDRTAHPWQLAPAWDGAAWTTIVRPGFVNGADVTIESAAHAALTEDPAPLLLLGPNFRNPVLAGRVPAVFAPILSDGTRQLRACDVALFTPRPGSSQRAVIYNPPADAQTVEITTTFSNARVLSAPSRNWLAAVPELRGFQPPTPLDRLRGTAVESEQDELLIATVWFVSPEDEPDGNPYSAPARNWTPFVQNFVWWNLAHATRARVGAPVPRPIRLATGLLGGFADNIFNSLLSPNNDLSAQIYAYLQASDFSGRYWTPGPIGADSQPHDNLNPRFPFERTAFDPQFFGL